MMKFFRRFWAYITASTNQKFNEKADPKIQLEQAIAEAQQQHKRLKEQAAMVIAQRTLAETQLDKQMEELENLNTKARQAVKMADEAAKAGDTEKATQYTRAAETIATQLIAVESQVASSRELVLTATEQAEQAKAAVATNGQVLQQRLAEKQELLGKLEQAKMQEQMNKAMSSLSETVGDAVPTLKEVSDKIDQRYAKAKGMSELNEASVDSRMLEIEQAAQNSEANDRLDQIRAQMGIETSAPAAPVEAPAVATEPPAEPTPQASPGT